MKRQLTTDLLWLCPYQVNDLVRLGRNHDGGYITSKTAIDSSTALLGLGLGDDWSFENHWHTIKSTDSIHIYDGSDCKNSWNQDLIDSFQKFCHGSVKYIDQNITAKNFEHALDLLGNRVFVKMDIEGSEYELTDLIIRHCDRITGITMEFHDCNGQRQKFVNTVKKLNNYFKIVHFHGNTYSGDTYFERPMLLTDALEISFVHPQFCESSQLRTQVHIPELDWSNCENFEDIEYFF